MNFEMPIINYTYKSNKNLLFLLNIVEIIYLNTIFYIFFGFFSKSEK